MSDTGTEADDTHAVVTGALSETPPPGVAVMPSVRVFVPLLQTTA